VKDVKDVKDVKVVILHGDLKLSPSLEAA